MSAVHELKTDPAVFAAVAARLKTHEIRLNDRGFQVGDTLLLRETVSTGEEMRTKRHPLQYTGRTETRTVSHIQAGYGLADGWCILSFAAPQVALTDALPELPTLPEFDSAADIEYTKAAPEDWDEDYRSIWTKLQVESRNKMQWRAHALELRKLLTYAQQCIEARNQQGDAACPKLTECRHCGFFVALNQAPAIEQRKADKKGGK